MSELRIGFAITGSFCTFKVVFPQMNLLVEHGYRVIPIMSDNAYGTDTRFGNAADWVAQAEEICGERSFTPSRRQSQSDRRSCLTC